MLLVISQRSAAVTHLVMTCEHLRALELAIIARGIRETSRGKPWLQNCRESIQLAQPEKPKIKEGMTKEEIAKLEEEMEALERDLKAVEESYAENMLNLTLILGYTKKLLENVRVARFLSANYPDIFSEFQSVTAAQTL